MDKTQADRYVPWLDGVRGIAAGWVLLAHAIALAGLPKMPVVGWGGMAVDLFMLLSGYLMAHHYLLGTPQWESPITWRDFWIRRIFRITPVYFLILAVTLAVAPALGRAREAIAGVWPSAGTEASRYAEASWEQALTHVTYVFGVLPDQSFNTPLPDWSISLEMQFYLVLPFLMLLFRATKPVVASIALVVVCNILLVTFADYFNSFAQPSALPMKLHLFLAGMLIAYGRLRGRPWVMLGTAALVTLLGGGLDLTPAGILRTLMAAGFAYLMLGEALRGGRPDRLLVSLRSMLGSRPAAFLGDTSYSVYLIHLPILTAVAAWLTTSDQYVAAAAPVRLVVCLGATVAVTYPVAWVLYRTIETRGIALGGKLRRKLARPEATEPA